jgi:predicted permease
MRSPRFFQRGRRLRENAAELEFYVESEARANMERGMSREDAYSAARRKLGNPALIREDVYRATTMALPETIIQDVAFALRKMRGSPVFTVTVVMSLALGIGGNTAAFSVVRSILLKPLQYRDPDRLVQITADYPRRQVSDTTFSKNQFDKFKEEQQSFASMGTFLSSTEPLTLSGDGEPEALKGARVSANFLTTLGVEPALGRSFIAEEEARGGPDVAILSNALWRRRFRGDTRILGKIIDLNATPYTVVGVLSEAFSFPMPGVDVWLTKPSAWSALPMRVWDITTSQIGFARLKPGVSLKKARAEVDLLNGRAALADSGLYVPAMRITRLSDHVAANIRPTLWILFGVVCLVLLITCANVANLMLVRMKSREREFAIRTSLGAPSRRLIRQLLTESVLLTLLGAAAGLLLARLALAGLKHVTVLNLPGVSELRLDGVVFAFTLVVSIATGILFGLFPSLQLLRRELIGSLRESGVTAGQAASHRPVLLSFGARGPIVVAQVAMSMVLLIGATLLLKSFMRLRDVNPGFQPSELLTAKLTLAPVRYDTSTKRIAFAGQLLERVETIPGVRNSAMALSLPATTWYRTNMQIQGKPWDPNPGNWPSIQIQSVTPGYFRTLQIPMERGRDFTELDNRLGAPPVVVINQSFARRFWPAYPRGENPVGEHMREGADKTDWLEIVGVAADVREGGFALEPLPEFYVPWVIHSPQTPYLVVRTVTDPLHLAASVRKQVEAIDPQEALSDVQSMNSVLESTLGQRRLLLWLVTSFSAIAFLLAVVGIYGIVAYSVTQRTQEIGIRRALGAQKGDIFRIVLGQAFLLALCGALLGVFGAVALRHVIGNLLFGVAATDPVAFCSTVLLFLAVVMAASFLPARRAANVDPMRALRVA